MALVLLAMSVGETSLKGQYLIDQGEYLSLVGLVFILAAGLYLHRQGRLVASLPLVFPWLLYPVITQGDQIIDNLSITWMRIIVHVLLAAIFAMPVAVVVYAARWLMKLSPPASRNLAIALLAIEIVLAQMFLGWLMIGTLIAMIALVWFYGGRNRGVDDRAPGAPQRRRARRAGRRRDWFPAVCIWVSRTGPGAYQGSPSFYMDPSRPDSGFVSAITVPTGPLRMPAGRTTVQRVERLRRQPREAARRLLRARSQLQLSLSQRAVRPIDAAAAELPRPSVWALIEEARRSRQRR